MYEWYEANGSYLIGIAALKEDDEGWLMIEFLFLSLFS
jgi:hypothetical protein